MRRLLINLCVFSLIFQNESFCYTVNDSAFSNNNKVSIPKNLSQSILLPSYASYKSENYILSSFQVCLDLIPFYLVANHVQSK